MHSRAAAKNFSPNRHHLGRWTFFRIGGCNPSAMHWLRFTWCTLSFFTEREPGSSTATECQFIPILRAHGRPRYRLQADTRLYYTIRRNLSKSRLLWSVLATTYIPTGLIPQLFF